MDAIPLRALNQIDGIAIGEADDLTMDLIQAAGYGRSNLDVTGVPIEDEASALIMELVLRLPNLVPLLDTLLSD